MVTPALAADLAVKAPVSAPVAPSYNWDGCYLGGNIGYSWGRARGDLNAPGLANFGSWLPTSFPISVDPDGVIGGGQVGCNWQYNSAWVLGLETDFQGSGEKRTENFSTPFLFGEGVSQSVEAKIEWFGTVRGRAGYLITPALMLYGTGGLAYGKTSVSDNVSGSLNFGGGAPGPVPVSTSISSSKTRVGWTLGAGVEGALFALNNWTWKVEYLYVDLGSQSSSGVDPIFGSYSWNTRFTDNILRFGLNYRIP